MIWLAVTSPTPGKVSSCSAVAVFRSSGTPGGPAPPAAPVPPGWAVPEANPPSAGAVIASPCRGILISSPSTSLRARLTASSSAPGAVPPAASIASRTRLPWGGAIAALGGTVGPGTRQDQACPAAAGGRGGWRVGGTRLGVQPQGSGGGQGQDSDDGDGDALARDAVEQALEAGPPAGGLHDEGGRR